MQTVRDECKRTRAAFQGMTEALFEIVELDDGLAAVAPHELARRQAAEPAPIGFATLNGGTTGGAAGETVTVSDLAALTEAAESEEPLTIIVSGAISGSAKIRVGSDKTIYGEAGSCKFLFTWSLSPRWPKPFHDGRGTSRQISSLTRM